MPKLPVEPVDVGQSDAQTPYHVVNRQDDVERVGRNGRQDISWHNGAAKVRYRQRAIGLCEKGNVLNLVLVLVHEDCAHKHLGVGSSVERFYG